MLFLDESGTHDLVNIDPEYPVLVLGGVIVETAYLPTMEATVQAFKQEVFGRTDLILHTADIARNKNGFERLQDATFREHFYVRLNELMQTLEYKVVACAIKTEEHKSQYSSPVDPYMYGLEILIERFCHEMGATGTNGKIVVEKRRPDLDRQLELAWQHRRTNGTDYCTARRIAQNIAALESRWKRDNIAGLQLADLVVSPIGRFVLGKPTKEDFRIIEGKFRRRRNGNYRGYGLVILP